MPRVVRGQLALDTGDRLRNLADKILHLHEYSGEALEVQLRTTDVAFRSALSNLDSIIRSCRTAKNSYPNYPALRTALAEAGDVVYNIRQAVEELRSQLGDVDLHSAIGKRLIEVSQDLRLVQFVPPEGGKQAAG